MNKIILLAFFLFVTVLLSPFATQANANLEVTSEERDFPYPPLPRINFDYDELSFWDVISNWFFAI